MDITQFLESLYNSSLATGIRDSLYAFPLIESFHVIGLTMVFGTIAVIDLRLLGLASAHRPFTKVTSDILKWTWGAFVLTVTTGLLMFITNALVYYRNPQFRAKMVLLVFAGINMAIFELTANRKSREWDNSAVPLGGKIAGACSILLWISVIVLGRWVGFTAGKNLPTNIEIDLEKLF